MNRLCRIKTIVLPNGRLDRTELRYEDGRFFIIQWVESGTYSTNVGNIDKVRIDADTLSTALQNFRPQLECDAPLALNGGLEITKYDGNQIFICSEEDDDFLAISLTEARDFLAIMRRKQNV